MRKAVMAAAATLATVAMPAFAQVAGAPMAMATPPGAWGPQGWQPGMVPPPAPGFTNAPAQNPAAMPAPAQPVSPHVYDRIEPGRKVKGPALANYVADPANWGLPMPGPGMRWIRYYDDAVLIDAKNRAIDIRSVPWNAPRPPVAAYAARPLYPAPAPMRAPGVYRERHGNTVTTTRVLPPPAMVGSYGPYGQIVSVTPGTVTTTTRTYWTGKRPSRARHAYRR